MTAPFHPALSRLIEDRLLVVLTVVLTGLMLTMPDQWRSLPARVDWSTIAILAGLMVLSRGLEDSGYLTVAGRWLTRVAATERRLALALVWFSALLSAVVTNDVALFIVVPLTVILARRTPLNLPRLVIFQALAVNAGSAISPIGNPQNLLLWQASELSFGQFLAAMAPLSLAMMALLTGIAALAFAPRALADSQALQNPPPEPQRRRLLGISLLLYPVFLLLVEQGWGLWGLVGICGLYALRFRGVLMRVDWLILVIFILMFMVLGLLAEVGPVARLTLALTEIPGGIYSLGALLSQGISNVPAAIFLVGYTDDLIVLAWGVNVGGFGLAIGSMANLIALRLARQPGLWWEFHRWSVPVLAASFLLGLGLVALSG